MKKNTKRILSLALLAFGSTLFGQGRNPCPQNTVTTKPNAPGSSNIWDWRINPIPVVEKIKNAPPLSHTFSNPYWDFNNNNTLPLVRVGPSSGFQDQRDYQPDSGWELIHKEFDNLVNPGNGVVHPMFVLYNKYRSLLRVFIAISDREEDYNGVYLKLSFANTNPNDKGSALFAYTQPITNAIDDLSTNQDMRVFNEWANVDDYWLYGDFFVAYDPCTCNEQSKLRIEAFLSETADVNLVTKGKNSASQTKDAVTNSTINTLAGTYDYVMKFTNDATEAANKKKKSATEAIESVNGVLKFLGDTTNTGKQKFKLPKWVKSIPKVGAVIGVLEFMFTGTNKEQATVVGTQEEYTTGTIIKNKRFKYKVLITPGAKRGTAALETVPEYNNILGVFNLLETPKVEYIDYFPNVPKIKYIGTGGDLLKYEDNPTIREYKMKEDLKYVLNPAAGLKIVNVQCALVYEMNVPGVVNGVICNGSNTYKKINYLTKYNYGPVETGVFDSTVQYNDRLESQGIYLNYWPGSDNNDYIRKARYNTRYVAKECFINTRFRAWNNTAITIHCKLVITYKPKGSTSNNEVVSVLTFPVTLEQSSLYKTEDNGGPKYYFKNLERHRERYFDWGCLCWRESNNQEDYHEMPYFSCIKYHPITHLDPSPFGNDLIKQTEDHVVLENINFTSNTTILAWETITIKSGVTMAPGITLELIAGEEIKIGSGFMASPGFSARIDRMPFCSPTKIAPVSQSEINTYCSSNQYKQLIALSSPSSGKDTNIAPVNEAKQEIELYPNPSRDKVFVKIISTGNDHYSAILRDIQGRIINQTQFEVIDGLGNTQFNTSTLSNGVYFVTVIGGNQRKTKKMMVMH